MPFLQSITSYITEDPLRILQIAVIAIAVILLFLLLFTLRDIMLRTRSFGYQFFSILLVGALPIVGFLLYLLIRPARTLKERDTDDMLQALLGVEEDDRTTMEKLNDDLIMIEEHPESDLSADIHDADEPVSESSPPVL